jgi:hypothetical protein
MSKIEPAECSGQWPNDFAHVPRPGPCPVLLLYFAAPLSHCPERRDLRTLAKIQTARTGRLGAMRSEVKEEEAACRRRGTETGHRQSRGLPMPVEGSGRWPEHERSIAPSRSHQTPVLFDVNSPSPSGSKVKPTQCSGQWPSNFAHVLRPGTFPGLHFAAPLSHCPERRDLRILARIQTARTGRLGAMFSDGLAVPGS